MNTFSIASVQTEELFAVQAHHISPDKYWDDKSYGVKWMASEYWNFHPITMSALWDYCMGDDWWFEWDNDEAIAPFGQRIVNLAEKAKNQWPDTVYACRLELDWDIRCSRPWLNSPVGVGTHSWATEDHVARVRAGGRSVQGTIRAASMAPLTVEEFSWLTSPTKSR